MGYFLSLPNMNGIHRQLQQNSEANEPEEDKNEKDYDAVVSGMTLMLVAAGMIALMMITILIWFCIHHKKIRLSPNNELVILSKT